MKQKRNDEDSSLSHTKWNCTYHIVFAPKYRRKEIYGKLRSDIGKYLRRLCEYKGVEIVVNDNIRMYKKYNIKMYKNIHSFCYTFNYNWRYNNEKFN